MAKLFSIASLILALVFFPPAVLAVVSNNAVPGDSTYPIKRGLEDVIYAVASLNPNTKALFAKARSDRRFQEVTVLLTQKKEAKKTLNELVEQTQIAANQISKVSDPVEKEKLINQLSGSITQYDTGLSQISQTGQIPQTAQPTPGSPVSTSIPTSSPKPQVVSPTVQPAITPKVTMVPQVSPTPSPSKTPSSSPVFLPSPTANSDIDKTRDELDKIKKKLGKERQHQNRKEEKSDNEEKDKNEQKDRKDKKDKRED